MRKGILLLFVAALFASCGSMVNYWHEEEDDVYFVSDTREDVDIIIYDQQSQSGDGTYDRSGTQNPGVIIPGNRRTTRRPSTRTSDPGYCPPGGTGTQSRTPSRTSTPSTTPRTTPRTSPAPSRQRPRPTTPKSSVPR